MIRSTFAFALTASRSGLVHGRLLHSSPVALKTVTEKVSEVADNVNKKVGKGLASAIETGQDATNAAKQSMGNVSEMAKDKQDEASKAAGQKINQTKSAAHQNLDAAHQKAREASQVAVQKMNQAAAGAKEAKEDFKKEMKK